MDLGIKNKRALVTGAGRGIGAAVVSSLAAEGVKIAVVSRTKGANRSGHYEIITDLTRTGAPGKVVTELWQNFGPIDIVINNLGDTLGIKDPFCSLVDWRKLWRINMEVALEINNLLIPHMQKRKWGRIVHISSISALENQGPVPYCAIKAALTAYTRAMGRIVSVNGIIMTAVLPGAVFTQGGYWDKTLKTNPLHVRKFIHERMAINRLGTPEEIAAMVTFLSSEMATFCVGSVVPIDGGQGRVFFPHD